MDQIQEVDIGEPIIKQQFSLSGNYEADKELAMAGLALSRKLPLEVW